MDGPPLRLQAEARAGHLMPTLGGFAEFWNSARGTLGRRTAVPLGGLPSLVFGPQGLSVRSVWGGRAYFGGENGASVSVSS